MNCERYIHLLADCVLTFFDVLFKHTVIKFKAQIKEIVRTLFHKDTASEILDIQP